MSQADELLNNLVTDYMTMGDTDDRHIIVNRDRTITVPEELRHIAVQYDHNVETVTFDCPRYWDGHDLYTMNVYINYERPDAYRDQYPVKNLRIDEDDDSIMHFEWTISKNVTLKQGNVTFIVCIKTADETGKEEVHWNSRRNNELIVDPGLECSAQVIESDPDAIEVINDRLDGLEEDIDDLSNASAHFTVSDDGNGNVTIA